MSKTEILNELPNLNIHDRRDILKKIFELEEGQDAMQFGMSSADLAFQALDELESES